MKLSDRQGEASQTMSGLLRVFVYGTLKPGEINYPRYCEGKVIQYQKAIAQGQLFALPVGYPALTLGDHGVQGYLLTFAQASALTDLDRLEDYSPNRSTTENEYERQWTKIFDERNQSLGWAWAYFMTLEKVQRLGGVLLPGGCWQSQDDEALAQVFLNR